MEDQNKDAAAVEKEGASVTGGAGAPEKEKGSEHQEGGEEYIPKKGTKKEDMTGYNELPEQTKVGGD